MSHAGYHKAIDHMAVVRFDGESHVILEHYECASCNPACQTGANWISRND